MSDNKIAATSNTLASDVKGLDNLRKAAKENSPVALKATAKQFEAMFMNMVLKSMRDATPKAGLFDSEQGKMFGSMLDQQLSQTMANKGVGLADMLTRQLSNNKSTVNPADNKSSLNPSVAASGILPGKAIVSAEASLRASNFGVTTLPVSSFLDKTNTIKN
jgi:flagellar protein FlgJ